MHRALRPPLFLLLILFSMCGCRSTPAESIDSAIWPSAIEWHPAFRNPLLHVPADATVVEETANGPIPSMFILDCGSAFGIAHADIQGIAFVHIAPQNTDIGYGITIPIKRGFYISRTELSNAAFLRYRYPLAGSYEQSTALYVDARSALLQKRVDSDSDALERYIAQRDMPAVFVSLTDAMVLCDSVSAQTGLTCRLPTISEWLCAMRAGRASRYWWGDNPPVDAGAERHRDLLGYSAELRDVENGERNPFGIINLLGNVAEAVIPSCRERKELHEALRNSTLTDEPSNARMMPYAALLIGGDVLSADAASLTDPVAIMRKKQLLPDDTSKHMSGLRLIVRAPD